MLRKAPVYAVFRKIGGADIGFLTQIYRQGPKKLRLRLRPSAERKAEARGGAWVGREPNDAARVGCCLMRK